MKHDIEQVTAALKIIAPFMPEGERSVITSATRGEEGQHFIDLICDLADLISNMPKTYEQDGKGDQAIVSLHYFRGGADWYITEKDIDPKDEETGERSGQVQAFGYANLFHDQQGGELGYISIVELVGLGVELDLYFEPVTLAEVKAKENERDRECAG